MKRRNFLMMLFAPLAASVVKERTLKINYKNENPPPYHLVEFPNNEIEASLFNLKGKLTWEERQLREQRKYLIQKKRPE